MTVVVRRRSEGRRRAEKEADDLPESVVAEGGRRLLMLPHALNMMFKSMNFVANDDEDRR